MADFIPSLLPSSWLFPECEESSIVFARLIQVNETKQLEFLKEMLLSFKIQGMGRTSVDLVPKGRAPVP